MTEWSTTQLFLLILIVFTQTNFNLKFMDYKILLGFVAYTFNSNHTYFYFYTINKDAFPINSCKKYTVDANYRKTKDSFSDPTKNQQQVIKYVQKPKKRRNQITLCKTVKISNHKSTRMD